MEFIFVHAAAVRAVSELILVGICILLCLKYRAARNETICISQAGRSFLRGIPVNAVSKIKSAEGRSLVRLLQMSATKSKREKYNPPTSVGIELEGCRDLDQLGEALIRAINNHAIVQPKAVRIFHKKDGKLFLLSQSGLVSGRFGRIIFEIVEEHQVAGGNSASAKVEDSLRTYGIRQQFVYNFELPDLKDEVLILWLGFDELHSSSFKEHRLAIQSLVKNLNVVIWQFKRIANLERVLGYERDVFLGISHDLKAPGITALYLIRELQNSLGEPESNRSVYMDLEILVLEQLSLIHDYLDIEMGRTTSVSASPQTFDIQRFIGEVSDSPLVRHDKNGVQFETLILAHGSIVFDRNHLKRIVLNLVSNALKYCKNGKVILGVNPISDREIELYVSDSGRGIPIELSEKLFSKFQRLAAAGGTYGNGVGLAASQLLAESNGSKLNYEPRPGGGSIFSLILTRSESTISMPSRASRRQLTDNVTVLIVEDDEATCRLYHRILSASGYRTENQSSIQGARLSLLSGRKFLAMITDFKLPDGDCFTLLKEISQRGLGLPTLIVSGMTEWSPYHRQLREVMERVFAVRFLEKPIERREFEAAFAQLVEEDSSGLLELNLRS